MRAPALATAAVIGLTACGRGPDGGQSAADEEGTEQQPAATSTADPFASPRTGEDREPAGPAPEQPEWSGPPEDEIGSVADIDPVVFEGDDAVVAVTAMTVYSTGTEIDVVVRTRPGAEEGLSGEDPMGGMGQPPSDETGGEPPDDLLRIGVVQPDGGSASTLDDWAGADEEPTGPLLTRTMSQGSDTSFEYEMWLWPLPDAGGESLEVAVQWPERGIDEREAIDPERLESAAHDVVQLWR
ncbi:hypothetical protein [Modestobacter sp. VKM Ac-2985]|uniref:hypothetical protein n=1 Tax=Modestobacter sp. VKM Ac-2985 TaxID=3004139 RepID=UPI0022AB80E4|nr:hypothetical protein [Modestobacter sp. VKM Ac-2985]MCZ2839765.1 hypothetical protein [Modestobacter sp. VKM Ac-2985]